MKFSNLVFESALLGITIILGLLAMISAGNGPLGELVFIYFLWLIPLGILQLIHALVLAGIYWKFTEVRKYLTGYFLGVAIDFGLLLTGYLTETLELMIFLAIILIPIALSILLWYITYLFRSPALEQVEEKEPADLL